MQRRWRSWPKPQTLPPMDIEQIIASRRTHKRFDGSPVERPTLEALLQALAWAPNHRRTQPWRAYVCEQPAVRALGSWLQDNLEACLAHSDKPDKDRSKVAKLAGHYLSSIGAIITVTQVISSNALQDREDHAAVAAGVQNVLLAAEARGLASFWSSSGLLRNPELLHHLGVETTQERFVASIWLGGVVDTPAAPPAHDLTEWVNWTTA